MNNEISTSEQGLEITNCDTNMPYQIAEARETIFDDDATALIGPSCKKNTDELGYTDPNTLPLPVSIKRGTTKIFQMRFSRSSTLGNIDFILDNIFEDMEAIEEIAPTYMAVSEEMAQPLPSTHAAPNSAATPTLPLISTSATSTFAATPALPITSTPPYTDFSCNTLSFNTCSSYTITSTRYIFYVHTNQKLHQVSFTLM